LYGEDRLENGKTYLEDSLDELVGYKNLDRSFKRTVFSGAVRLAVNLGCAVFNLDRKGTVEALKVPHFRRGLVNVLTGIGKYGVTKPYRVPAPFLVVWNYTNACNLRCKHCCQSADEPTPDELSTEERLSIVDQLDKNNVSALAFSGGEPLMRRDLFEVARYASDKGLYVSVATNGTPLRKKTVERLRRSGVRYVEISLDGARKETHEFFRGAGSFDKTVRGIRNSVEFGMFTCIATTATRRNVHEIPRIVKMAKNLGANRLLIFNFIPTGRGEKIVNLDLSPTEREDLLKYLYQELADEKTEAFCTAPQYSRVCLEQSLISKRDMYSPTHFAAVGAHGQIKQLAEYLGGCGAGRLYCAIQPNGLVTPCVFMPIVVGDLRRQSLKEIWLNSKVMNDLRDRDKLKGRCGHCQYKRVCGGCRARAYAYYDDYLAPDPGCIRELEEPSTLSPPRNLRKTEILSAEPPAVTSQRRR
jgi:radical SAM protein with 4Fe4S-binding SPASM domain